MAPRIDAKRLARQYSELARSVPIFTLEYERRFAALPHLVRAIRERMV